MKFVRFFLVGIVVCAFNACEQQPYSKIESMTEGQAHAEKAGAAHDEKAQKPGEATPAEKKEIPAK